MSVKRAAHRIYANIMGYFWLACDWCGYEFGGHERGWRSRAVGSDEPLLCYRCAPNYLPGRGVRHQSTEPESR